MPPLASGDRHELAAENGGFISTTRRHDAGIEVVVDVRGVKPRRADGGKELR